MADYSPLKAGQQAQAAAPLIHQVQPTRELDPQDTLGNAEMQARLDDVFEAPDRLLNDFTAYVGELSGTDDPSLCRVPELDYSGFEDASKAGEASDRAGSHLGESSWFKNDLPPGAVCGEPFVFDFDRIPGGK